jgi:peptidoglycan-N-acetylglucosamine deacetylase
MEENHATPAEGKAHARGTPMWWAAICLGVLVLLAAAAYFLVPYPVSVDGRTQWVHLGITLSALQAKGLFTATPGDLVSVRMKVLKDGGGNPPTFYVNGKMVGADARVWPGSNVRTATGSDRTESVLSKRAPLPIGAHYVGHGPMVTMTQTGTAGVSELLEGRISGEVLQARTLTPAQPAVFERARYAGKAKVVALTFDDGPQPTYTPRILKILRSAKVKATFFMIGRQARRYPALARAVRADGNVIGNHSLGHKSLAEASRATVVEQVAGGASAIKAATGIKPFWYRPAGGSLSNLVYEIAQANDERVIVWSLDPDDWKRPSPAALVKLVVSQVRSGSVVLLHDGGGNRTNTIAALPEIIAKLRAQGYHFITLDQMFAVKSAATVSKASLPATAAANR